LSDGTLNLSYVLLLPFPLNNDDLENKFSFIYFQIKNTLNIVSLIPIVDKT